MNKQQRGPKIDQKMFDCVKILLQSGATRQEIEKYTNLGKTAIYRISICESFQDYKDMMAAFAIEQRKRREENNAKKAPAPAPEPQPEPEKPAAPAPQPTEHKYNVTLQTTYYVSQKLDAMTELLKTISAKLACIIDDLYGTGKKEA